MNLIPFIVPMVLIVAWSPHCSAGFKLDFANLHNPHFSDRQPGSSGKQAEPFIFAPAPAGLFGIRGDTLPVAFTLFTTEAQTVSIQVKLTPTGIEAEIPNAPTITLYRATDVQVEGNFNGSSCTCPAGQLPQTGPTSSIACVPASLFRASQAPNKCPSDAQRAQIANRLIRRAPFVIKDPLEPLLSPTLNLGVNTTELLIADIPVEASLPKGDLVIRVTAKPQSGPTQTIVMPLKILNLRLEQFPSLEVSYWLSEDPRDLVARPIGTSLGGQWGGNWWSEEHWRNLEHAAQLQAKLGVTNVLVPLFVRSPFGVNAKPLITVRCITNSTKIPTTSVESDGSSGLSPFNKAVSTWQYDFDFSNFHRFVDIFKRAGFRRFEGAHLLLSQGQLPPYLECDLYQKATDTQPFSKNFQFMPAAVSPKEPSDQRSLRVKLYRESFLPAFMRRLTSELRIAGIDRAWYQHLIDENVSDEAGIANYGKVATIVHNNMFNIPTMDAVNQYAAPRYRGMMDLPALNLALLYDDQLHRKNIQSEVRQAFPGNKYFYNTNFLEGGPNRSLDTNPIESRAYGWLAVELGYQGMLYWAANRYRYPVGPDITRFNRAEDWSPFNHSIGPLPNGYIEPGHTPGANWNLYPTPSGLTDSLRARRLRDGLLDHWIYMKARNECQKSRTPDCATDLDALRIRLTFDPAIIADFSKNPAEYDAVRTKLLQIIEPH